MASYRYSTKKYDDDNYDYDDDNIVLVLEPVILIRLSSGHNFEP
jgi:hypothetical protein